MKTYSQVIFFDQYHNIKVEKGKRSILDPHLVLPPLVDMRKSIDYLDMIDTRTNMSVRETVLMLKRMFHMERRIYESIKDRPESEY